MQEVINSSNTSRPHLNAELLDKARRLKDSPFFVHPSDGAEMVEKWEIFLVLAGYKPVSEVASGHWIDVPGGRRTVPDDPELVGAFLQELGLAYHLSNFDDHATDAVVAVTPELVEQYMESSGSSAIGTLFGYPASAVRAFAVGESNLLSHKEQERYEAEAGLPEVFVMFRLSRKHWRDELNVVKKWYEVLREAGLIDGQRASLS